MAEPTKIPEAWAVAGDYNTIPSADPGNGLASWDMGFPVETQTPLAAGGTPPRRQDINGALYWLSLGQLWYQKGGLWQYDATENYEIGNVVEQNNAMYYCKAANGPSGTVKSPSADTAGTYWKKLVNADGTLNVPVISNASTTVTGIVELSTSAETKALTDATRAVTPSSLNGLLSLSPAALTVPKADSSGKLTGWLDALKDNDGRVNISIKGTAPQLQTARTVRVNLASTSTASFNGTTNITPGVNGTLGVANGGTGQTNLDAVTVGKAKALNTARTVRTNLALTATASFDGTANITPGVTGTLPVTNGGTGQTNLDAVTVGKAKALNTARTIQTDLASTSAANFNGTVNVTPGVTGVLPIANGGTGSNTKNFVDLTSFQIITGSKRIKGDGQGWAIQSSDGQYGLEFRMGNGVNRGIAVMGSGSWVLYRDESSNYFKGLADSSKKLETSRNLKTDLSSSNAVPFDGTQNATLGVQGTLAVSNGGTGQTNLDLVTVGKAKALNTARNINGTAFNGTASITTAQWGTARNVSISDAGSSHTGTAVSVNGGANVTLKLPATITGALNGNADTATSAEKLTTARTINGTSFNGTSDIVTAQWGTSRNLRITDATATNKGTNKAVNGTAAVELPLPATIKATLNGNADTATKLQTARTINGTPFDGSANIIAMESSDRNLVQNGYIRFQSGLLVQWGHTLVTNDSNNVVSFNKAFDTVFTVNATMQLVSGIGAGGSYTHISINSFNTTDFSVNANIEGGGAQIYINWIAIGK